MSLNNPQDNLQNNAVPNAADETLAHEEAVVLETDTIQSIQKTVIAEANAVLASNRKREPIVTILPNGTKRIDF